MYGSTTFNTYGNGLGVGNDLNTSATGPLVVLVIRQLMWSCSGLDLLRKKREMSRAGLVDGEKDTLVRREFTVLASWNWAHWIVWGS